MKKPNKNIKINLTDHVIRTKNKKKKIKTQSIMAIKYNL